MTSVEPDAYASLEEREIDEDLRTELRRCQRELQESNWKNRDFERQLEAAKTSRNLEAAKRGELEGASLGNFAKFYGFPIAFSGFAVGFTWEGFGGVVPRILSCAAAVVATLGWWRLVYETRWRGRDVDPLLSGSVGLVILIMILVPAFWAGLAVAWLLR